MHKIENNGTPKRGNIYNRIKKFKTKRKLINIGNELRNINTIKAFKTQNVNKMQDITNTTNCSSASSILSQPNNQRKKIPRPANAFMIFANENRRKVAKMHPLESNKEISIRLGTQWKNLSPALKDKYFAMAKEVDDDHKRKYPDYVYNPKEARIRKALRDRERSIVNSSTARSRRSNWSRQSPAPQMPPIAHGGGDPHMNVPSKEFRSVIRHELEHGFLHNNGGYIYPSQQYLFTPQSEYMSYINAIPSSNWPANTYNMQNNNMVQQQIWNQYQADRVRSQQNQNYVLNGQGGPPQSDYQMEHMPPNNIQMVATSTPTSTPTPTPTQTSTQTSTQTATATATAIAASKSRMQQNIENAASDVDRYLNIPNTAMRSSPRNNIQLDQMPLQMVPNANSDDSIISATATSSSISNESNPRSIDMIGSHSHSNSHSHSHSQENTSISEADGSINLDNSDNAESGFVGGMQLFNEDVSSLNNTTDNRTNKGIMVTNQDCIIKQEPCTSSSSSSSSSSSTTTNHMIPLSTLNLNSASNLTLNSTSTSNSNSNSNLISKSTDLYKSIVPNPYFQMELIQANTNKQFVRSYLPSNTYFIEFPNTEPKIIKKQEIPLNYSAQKYYESVSNGNFDVPMMPIASDQYGGFVCDDGYSFVIVNQTDIQPPNYSYLPNQLEVNQFLTDPCDMIPVNMDSSRNHDDDDCILDLSKEAESEQEIDVGEENCSLDKFMDVSNRICEELSKIS